MLLSRDFKNLSAICDSTSDLISAAREATDLSTSRFGYKNEGGHIMNKKVFLVTGLLALFCFQGVAFSVVAPPPSEYSPSVAFDPTNNRYLLTYVVENGDQYDSTTYFGMDSTRWGESATGGYSAGHLVGELLNADTTLYRGPFLISPDITFDYGPKPVGFDSQNGVFLVVWQKMDNYTNTIYGRFLEADGTPRGNEFRVASSEEPSVSAIVGQGGIQTLQEGFFPAPGRDPRLVFDDINHRFLVVWTDTRDTVCTTYCTYVERIYGQFVNANTEGFLDGVNFPISDGSSAPGDSGPALAYDNISGRFLVAWEDLRNYSASGIDIYGQLMDKDLMDGVGNLIGSNFPIAESSSDQITPSLAYDPTDDKFLVTWLDIDWEANEGTLSGQFVKGGGTLNGNSFSISDSFPGPYYGSFDGPELYSAVAYDSANQRFLAVWTDARNYELSGQDIRGQFLDKDGTLLKANGTPGSENFLISGSSYDQLAPAIAFNSTSPNFLVAFETWMPSGDSPPPQIGLVLVNTLERPRDFGPVILGKSVSRNFTITNAGTFDLTVRSIEATGGDSSMFAVQPGGPNPCPSLSPTLGTSIENNSCTYTVTFSPTSVGIKQTTLRIISDAINYPEVNIPLTGTGVEPDIAVAPPALNFDSVPIGQSSSQDVIISNNADATADLSVSSIATSGGDSGSFSVIPGGAEPCSSLTPTLVPGQGCTVTVKFSPTEERKEGFKSSLVISSNDPDENRVVVTLEGSTVWPDIKVEPISVDFGGVREDNMNNPAQTIKVKNEGSYNLIFARIDQPSELFIVTGDCLSSEVLPPGGECALSVKFVPGRVTEGPVTSSISIYSNDRDENPVMVTLTGTGLPKSLPVRVDFGYVKAGSTKKLSVSVTPRLTGPVHFTVNGSPKPPFKMVTETELVTCAGNQVCRPTELRFSPLNTGAFTSGFSLVADEPNEPEWIVDLVGRSGPDVTGVWGPLQPKCKATKKGLICTASGTLTVRNIGTEKAKSVCLRFFFSDGDGSQKYLTQMSTTQIQPNGSQKIRVQLNLPSVQRGTTGHINAVLDSNNLLVEGDETNNAVSKDFTLE